MVSQLADKEGHVLTGEGSVSFTVGALKGSIPSDLRPEHAVHLAFSDLTSQRLAAGEATPSGTTYVEIIKTVNRQIGAPQTIAFDVSGNQVDPNKEIEALQQRRFQKYGRLSQTLFDKTATLKDTDTVDVQVWPIIDRDLQAYKKPTEGEQTG